MRSALTYSSQGDVAPPKQTGAKTLLESVAFETGEQDTQEVEVEELWLQEGSSGFAVQEAEHNAWLPTEEAP